MASGDSHAPAVSSTLPPNDVKRKLTPAAVVGVVVTLSVGALAFALGLAGLLSFKTQKYRTFNGFYYNECENKTALYLEWVSILISFVGAATASVFGGCPCCCYIRHYKKGITFSFSVVFLVLNWFCLGLTLFFRTRAFGIRVEDSNGCQRTTPEQLVAIVLTSIFGAVSKDRIRHRACGYRWEKPLVLRKNGDTRIVPPPEVCIDLVQKAHEGNGHFRVLRRTSLLAQKYWCGEGFTEWSPPPFAVADLAIG